MLLLSIETASRRGSVALLESGKCLREVVFPEGLIHGREITARIDSLLRETARSARDLSAIAVSVGPGSFTGIRVGVTAAKTLAYALEIPVVTESSLLVTAANASRSGPGAAVLTVLDARQGAFFWAVFETIDSTGLPAGNASGAMLRRRAPDAVDEPSIILGSLEREPGRSHQGGCVIGEGADIFLERNPACPWPRGDTRWDLPSAQTLGEMVFESALAARFDLEAVHRLEPAYLRATEAERKLAARGGS